MRAPAAAAAGKATVKLSLQGWPEGDVQPGRFEIPVVPRKATYAVRVSPRQRAVWRLDKGWEVTQVVAAPEGRDVIVASSRTDKAGSTDRLAVYDRATGRQRRVLLDLPPEERLHHRFRTIAFSPDGRWLAVSQLREGGLKKNAQGDQVFISADRVYLIDRVSGKVVRRLEVEGFGVLGFAFTPDSRTLATAQFNRIDHRHGDKRVAEFNGDIRLWEVATGKLLATWRSEPGEGASGLTLSPDGKTLAAWYWSASPDRKADRFCTRLWSLPEGTVRAVLPDQYSGEFSADGRWLLTQSIQGKLLAWDMRSGQEHVLLSFDYPKQWLQSARLPANSRSVFCSFSDNRMLRVEVPSGKILAEQPAPAATDPARRSWTFALSRDSRWFAVASYTQPPYRMSGTLPEDWDEVPPPEIAVWDTTTLRRLATLTGHVGRVADLAFTPDADRLLSGGVDGTVRVWDLSDLVPSAKR